MVCNPGVGKESDVYHAIAALILFEILVNIFIGGYVYLDCAVQQLMVEMRIWQDRRDTKCCTFCFTYQTNVNHFSQF